METTLAVILAIALAISLFFNYRLYCYVKAYQRAFSDLARKQLMFMAASGLLGAMLGKTIADRLAGRDE